MTYILWIVLAVAFLIVEFNTVSLISIWFVGGALVALAASLMEAALWLQIVLFVTVSALLLVLLRPFLKRYVNPLKVKTNVDALPGQRAVVTQTVDNLAGTGEVRLGGSLWTARAREDQVLQTGTVVTVTGVEGVKLIVIPAAAGSNN